jgi:branched-chain amino acid transport system ATP-binding protein
MALRGDIVLSVSGLSHAFGGLRAVHEFGIVLCRGEIKGLIGPNGAGKTTVFNLITGVYCPDRGMVKLHGEELRGLPSHVIIGKGVSRTFQNIRLFKSMTVLDNVITAGYCRLGYSLWSALARTGKFVRMEREVRQKAQKVLEAFGLAGRMHEQAAALPYGLQRKVELARAVVSGPSVLLLDEPAAGMNPAELDELAALIRWVRDEFNVCILLIEHRMRMVMGLCGSVTVLNFGETIFEGPPSGLADDPQVCKAYFGEDHETTLG